MGSVFIKMHRLWLPTWFPGFWQRPIQKNNQSQCDTKLPIFLRPVWYQFVLFPKAVSKCFANIPDQWTLVLVQTPTSPLSEKGPLVISKGNPWALEETTENVSIHDLQCVLFNDWKYVGTYSLNLEIDSSRKSVIYKVGTVTRYKWSYNPQK